MGSEFDLFLDFVLAFAILSALLGCTTSESQQWRKPQTHRWICDSSIRISHFCSFRVTPPNSAPPPNIQSRNDWSCGLYKLLSTMPSQGCIYCWGCQKSDNVVLCPFLKTYKLFPQPCMKHPSDCPWPSETFMNQTGTERRTSLSLQRYIYVRTKFRAQ